jgi:hypothetical protein
MASQVSDKLPAEIDPCAWMHEMRPLLEGAQAECNALLHTHLPPAEAERAMSKLDSALGKIVKQFTTYATAKLEEIAASATLLERECELQSQAEFKREQRIGSN